MSGVDCDETFSLVVKLKMIRTALSLVVSCNWPIHQLCTNAFLHGHIQETVYMHQPPSFRDPSHPDHVFLIQKSLCGLNQALKASSHRFAQHATKLVFSKVV